MASTHRMKYLVIHCTASPLTDAVTPDLICQLHIGPKNNGDGTYLFKSKTYTKKQMEGKTIRLWSGAKIKALSANGRGWRQVGYSDMINSKGQLINLVPYSFDEVLNSYEVTNGAAGYNSVSRHIVLAGGYIQRNGVWIKNGKDPKTGLYLQPEELYTEDMMRTLRAYIEMQLRMVPSLIVVGHNQLTNQKTCPNFDVRKFLEREGLLK